MTQQNVEQGQATETKAPFAELFGEEATTETKQPTLAERRASAVERARELLGDAADSADVTEAVRKLQADEHEFVAVMAGSPRQQRRFRADFNRTQPKSEGTGGRLAKKQDFQGELKIGRDALSAMRKATDADEVANEVARLRAIADAIEAKIA